MQIEEIACPTKIPAFTAEEKDQLQRLEKFDSNWRVRERVKTLLMLSEGQMRLEVAGKIGIRFRIVSYTRQGWLTQKFASLTDKPRCGAPLKMTSEERARVVTWAGTAPLSATELLAKYLDAGGTLVHAQTIKSLLRKEAFVWKCTRASIKKNK